MEGRKKKAKKEKVNNFNEGMISVQPLFLSCSEAGRLAGATIRTSPPAALNNFPPLWHLTSLVHLYVSAPEEKRGNKIKGNRIAAREMKVGM